MIHYTDDQLGRFLQEVDSDASDSNISDAELSHLEQCENCRSRLSKLAGEGPWLVDWMDSVGDLTSHFDDSDLGDSASSVVITVEPSDAMSSGLQCDSVRLDFLDDPSHPELLGRLGRYDIERLIGMGGFGVVFKARDSELNRVVAIKVLAPHLMNSGPARQRFGREAQASAAVVHDHVVPIYDVVADDKACYFVMQYIAGQSLQERVDRQGPLATEDVLRIAAQMAAGLQAAHEQGLIHRDVKPGNVLLEDSVNRVMISDFGLARAADDASITRSGAITGTPHYMSPEQAKGGTIDFRSDLFSLGSVIYFMCTGRSPFRAPQMMAVLNRVCHEAYRPIEEINANVPYELINIVDRLLSKDPGDRFETAEKVQRELQQLLSDFQSGNLRPRRFPAPNAIFRRHRSAILGSLMALSAVAFVVAIPALRAAVWGPNNSPGTTTAPAVSNSIANQVSSLPPQMPRGIGLAGSFVGDAIRQEVYSTLQRIESLELAANTLQDGQNQDPYWDGELYSINAMLTQQEQQLAVESAGLQEECSVEFTPSNEPTATSMIEPPEEASEPVDSVEAEPNQNQPTRQLKE